MIIWFYVAPSNTYIFPSRRTFVKKTGDRVQFLVLAESEQSCRQPLRPKASFGRTWAREARPVFYFSSFATSNWQPLFVLASQIETREDSHPMVGDELGGIREWTTGISGTTHPSVSSNLDKIRCFCPEIIGCWIVLHSSRTGLYLRHAGIEFRSCKWQWEEEPPSVDGLRGRREKSRQEEARGGDPREGSNRAGFL
jgi:hypothetical protein